MAHLTDRLYNKKWGVFTHYLNSAQNADGALPWADCVDGFDVKNVADTLHAVNAGYYFITLMQGHRYMLAPNAAYDRITGDEPGTACARRDLPLDLYKALHPYDIDLYLYYTGDGPFRDEPEGRAFGFTEPREKGVTPPFVQKWASVLEEYAVRYGDKVCGWWIDGCYHDYFKYTDALLQPYRDACRRGNPNAVVAFNDGVKDALVRDYALEDFTCGEFNDFTVVPKSRFIDGAQAHILAPLGNFPDPNSPWGSWCKPGCKRSKEDVLDYIRRVNEAGGVVTVDIVINRDGSFDPAQIELLQYVGERIER